MHETSTSDQADLILLAILFFFLVLFSASAAGEGQNAEQQRNLPQTIATTAQPSVSGTAI